MEKLAIQTFDKNALIVNGCNKLGAGLAQSFLQRGAKLIIPVGNITELKEMKGICGAAKMGKLIPFLGDMSDYDRTFDIAQVVADEYGLPDIIIAIFNYQAPKSLPDKNSANGPDEMNHDESSFIPGVKAFLEWMKSDPGHRAYIHVCSMNDDEDGAHTSSTPSDGPTRLKEEISKEFFAAMKDQAIRYFLLYIEDEMNDRGEMLSDYIIQLYDSNKKESDTTIHAFHDGAWEEIKMK